MKAPSGRGLGGKRSVHDSRDHRYAGGVRSLLNPAPPLRIDRRADLPPVWQQGGLGSCEGHGGAGRLVEMYPGFMPSRLAIYFAGRVMEGTTDQDVGMQTRDLMKVLQAGVISEDLWPYDESRFKDHPPVGGGRNIGAYSRLEGENEVVDFLWREGSVVLSFEVPKVFDSDAVAGSGVMPLGGDDNMIGGHCVLAVGYDLDFRAGPNFVGFPWKADQVEDSMLLCRNSWGADWGLKGYFWLPMSWAVDPNTGNDTWAAYRAPDGPQVAGIPITGSFTGGAI